jgi:hypothetical protein
MEEKRNKNCSGHKFCTNQIKPLANKKKKYRRCTIIRDSESPKF